LTLDDIIRRAIDEKTQTSENLVERVVKINLLIQTMNSHHTLPQWLARAIDSNSYVSDAWSMLAFREQKRAVARHASHNHRFKILKIRNDQNIDPVLLQRYSASIALNPPNNVFNRYLDVVPYDRNRVIPAGLGDFERYLNAR